MDTNITENSLIEETKEEDFLKHYKDKPLIEDDQRLINHTNNNNNQKPIEPGTQNILTTTSSESMDRENSSESMNHLFQKI
jgi:hypothetical protein